MAGEGEVEETVLVCLVKFDITGAENEMVEQFVHCQKTTTAIYQCFHLHETELIQAVSPKIESMAIFCDDLT